MERVFSFLFLFSLSLFFSLSSNHAKKTSSCLSFVLSKSLLVSPKVPVVRLWYEKKTRLLFTAKAKNAKELRKWIARRQKADGWLGFLFFGWKFGRTRRKKKNKQTNKQNATLSCLLCAWFGRTDRDRKKNEKKAGFFWAGIFYFFTKFLWFFS